MLPKQRRTGLFSATLDSVTKKDLQKLGLRNPVKIDIKVEESNNKSEKNAIEEEIKEEKQPMALPTTLQNYYQIFQKRTEKFAFLINFLVKHPNDKIIIFFNTCASVAYYHRILTSLSFLKGKS